MPRTREEIARLLRANLASNPEAAVRSARLSGLSDSELLDALASVPKPALSRLKTGDKPPATAELRSVPFASIEAQAIDWLYEGYLPRGMLITVFAPKGRGKTKIMDFFSARATTGRGWPGKEEATPPAVVLRFNLEDPERQVLRPSLQAAGADLRLVRFVERTALVSYAGSEAHEGVDLSREDMVQAIKAHIAGLGAALAIIEPINNYKGSAKANSEDDMRPIYNNLARIAKETNACVVAINHANKKKDVDVLEKSLGAGSGPAVARANFFLEKNPDDPSERILTNAGSNIPVGKSLVFTIESAPTFETDGVVLKDIGAARFLRFDDMQGDELLERVNTTKRSESDAIATFIREALAAGDEVPTEKIKAMALSENKDWRWDTIRQVFSRRRLGVSVGGGQRTKWRKGGPVPGSRKEELF